MGQAVVHFDISAQNPAALESFYQSVFGWTLNAIPDMNYTIVQPGGGHGIPGGIGPAGEGPGQIAFYVESDDLQADLDKAVSLGGRVTQEVIEIPGTVKLAMFADPAGNQVGLSGSAGGEPRVPTPGAGSPVTWFEVMGPDAPALVAFYSQLFGWKARDTNMSGPTSYFEMSTGSDHGIQGGIGSNPLATSYATVYAESQDLQATLDRAEELGGKTVLPPMQAGGGPRLAFFFDPEGHLFGIYTPT